MAFSVDPPFECWGKHGDNKGPPYMKFHRRALGRLSFFCFQGSQMANPGSGMDNAVNSGWHLAELPIGSHPRTWKKRGYALSSHGRAWMEATIIVLRSKVFEGLVVCNWWFGFGGLGIRGSCRGQMGNHPQPSKHQSKPHFWREAENPTKPPDNTPANPCFLADITTKSRPLYFAVGRIK